MAFNTETSFLVALVIAVVIFIGYLEWSSAKGRLMKKREVRMAATIAKDDAYNATVTTKAVARNLKAQGYDVSGAERLIGQAEAAIEMGNFKAAGGYAGDAKAALYAVKQRGVAVTVSTRTETSPPETKSTPGAAAGRSAVPGGRQKEELPRNYAQASFAISTLREAARNAQAEGADASATVELLAQAEEAFRQGNYDSALNTALKARKEGIAESGGIQGGLGTVKDGGRKASGAPVPTPASAEARPDCAAPLKEGDSFCRKCGTAFNFICPNCGCKLESGDVFCGKCGAGLK